MKKCSSIIFALGLILSSVVSQAEEKIKIGVSTALTGNAATYGVDIRNALLFANEKLAGNRYELIFDDDKCNGRDAVAVAHHLIDVVKVKYATGFACSSTVLSTANLYEQAKVLTMVVSASASDISKAGDYIFRTWASDAGAAKKLFEFISSRHKSLGIISEQTDYAQGFLRSFIDNNQNSHIEIFNESYLTDTPDYRSVILKIRSKGVEAIFVNSQTEATFIAIVRQLRELGWSGQVYSAYWAGTSTVLEKAKNLVEGSIYVDLPSVDKALNEEGRTIYNEYVAKFGHMQSVDLMFGTVFEGFRALDAAIRSGEDPRTYLYRTKFKGLFGDWSFDKNGDIQGLNFIIKTVKDGKAVDLD